MKKSKLSLNKYTIAKLNSLRDIIGGGETTTPSDICFVTDPSNTNTCTCNTIESEVMDSSVICLNKNSSAPCKTLQQL